MDMTRKLVKATSNDSSSSATTDYKLLHREEKKKCSKLELDNERLRRSVEILQKTLDAKKADIESKDAMINKLLEKGLNKALSYYLPDGEKSNKKDAEELDFDSLLQANFGDFDNFESVLDLSGTGNILPTDLLPDVTGEWEEEAANISVSIKEMLPCLNTSPQIPNRDGNIVIGEQMSLSNNSISESKPKEDHTIVSRLVDQQRNFASVQTKVSPLKIVLDKKRTPLIKRKQISPLRPIPQKNIRLDQVPTDGHEENLITNKRIKLEKHALWKELKIEKHFHSNKNRVNNDIVLKQRRSSDDNKSKANEGSSQRKRSTELLHSNKKNDVDFKKLKNESRSSMSNKHDSKVNGKCCEIKNTHDKYVKGELSNSIAQKSDKKLLGPLRNNSSLTSKKYSGDHSSRGDSKRRTYSSSENERKSSISSDIGLTGANPGATKPVPKNFNSYKPSKEGSSSQQEFSASNTSFRCPYCGKQFPRGGEWKLKKHIASEHEEQERGGNKKKQFTCHKCSADFSSNSVLISHMERHRRSPWKKNPWKCGACREKFSEMKQLAKHVKQYHGVKKWEKASKLVKF